MSQLSPGTCRYCRCTDATPCSVPPYNEGDHCGWIAGTVQTVCSSPSCLKAWIREQEAAKAAREAARPRSRFAGWGYGAIAEELRREARMRRRRKGRAA